MSNYIKQLLLIGILSLNKLDAADTCVLRPGTDLLTFEEAKNRYVCNKDSERDDLLDLNELTIVGGKPWGMNPGNVYKDNSGNIWFIKRNWARLGEYIGGHILRLFLGDDRIAEIKFVKGEPFLIASKKLENFETLDSLVKLDEWGNRDKMYSLLSNYEELVVGMNYVDLVDRHSQNQGYIKKNEKLEAASVDYDSSFGSGCNLYSPFFDSELFKGYIDYGKLERAIIDLLKLPDDQIHQIFEKGMALEVVDTNLSDRLLTKNVDAFKFLEQRKNNFKQLLPLIICLKKVLNEGDVNYLSEHKDILIAFQNMSEYDSGKSHLNILIHQLVQRGCVEALKKLKELGLFEYTIFGYGIEKEKLVEVAYGAKQNEILYYLLEDKFFSKNKNDLWRTLMQSLRNGDVTTAMRLIKAGASVNANNILEAALEGKCSIEMFDYLLEMGAKNTLQDRYGRYFIHRAARAQRSDIVELLVKYGADLDLCDEDGKTAYDYLESK